MAPKQASLAVKQHRSGVKHSIPVVSTVSNTNTFKLTLVNKRPKPTAQTKMIKLSCYHLEQTLSPHRELDRIRNCLELPHLSIEHSTAITNLEDNLITAHTLHMLIPVEELTSVSDYKKLLATLGYQSLSNDGMIEAFAKNKSKSTINTISKHKPSAKATINKPQKTLLSRFITPENTTEELLYFVQDILYE